jgi:hypothetical protein
MSEEYGMIGNCSSIFGEASQISDDSVSLVTCVLDDDNLFLVLFVDRTNKLIVDHSPASSLFLQTFVI